MRRVLAASLFSSLLLIAFACSNDVAQPLPIGNDSGGTGMGGASGSNAQASAGGTAQATSVNTATADGTSTTSATSVGSPTTTSSTTTATTTTGDAGTSASTTTGNPTNTTGFGGSGQMETCTDTPPDERDTTCAEWAAYGECDNPNGWLDDFCDLSCGRCTIATSTNGGGGASTTSNVTNTTNATDASTNTTGGDLGNDNPYSPIQGGTNGFATRYWDCCKPSCGWAGNANPVVVSCDKNDENRSANDTQNACEANGQSGAFTCHSMSPWAHSNVVSYGFAAVNGVACGTCFQIEFPGTSQRGGNDPGSAALAGKTMVVMATNIGGIEQNQFDLLIPGGGVGLLNGCSGQWGVDNSELGAQYGGFLSECRPANPEDHEAVKNCVRNKCESVFGSRGLTELYDGCMWFVDWFQAADNPDIRYQQISCPSDLTSVAY